MNGLGIAHISIMRFIGYYCNKKPPMRTVSLNCGPRCPDAQTRLKLTQLPAPRLCLLKRNLKASHDYNAKIVVEIHNNADERGVTSMVNNRNAKNKIIRKFVLNFVTLQ